VAAPHHDVLTISSSMLRKLLNRSVTPIIIGFGYISIHSTNSQTNCESKRKTKSETRCEAYNSFFNIFFEKRREELCLNEPGCLFRGKGITGTCYPKYKAVTSRDHGKLSNYSGISQLPSSTSSTTSTAMPSSLSPITKTPEPTPTPSSSVPFPITGELKLEEDSQIEILMKQQFTSSVADQIVNSHEAARKVAKDLVIEVLQNEGTVNQLGSLLGMCFEYPTVQAPIRSLAYFYLHTDTTMSNILWQLEWQRHYFFSGEGKDWTEMKLKELFMWWTSTEDFYLVISPLVLWVLGDREVSTIPLSHMNAEYYDFYRVYKAYIVIYEPHF